MSNSNDSILYNIDIIVTTRNNYSSLQRTLHSIYNQSYTNFRCFVIDDDSNDDSIDKLSKEFPQTDFITGQGRNGPARNRNIAAARGSGEFIVTLDDDIVLEKDWLEQMLAFISISDSIGSAGGQLRFIEDKERINSLGGYFLINGLGCDYLFNRQVNEIENLINYPLRFPFICSAAMIVRRSVFNLVQGFDKIFFYLGEDYDLGLRINSAGFKVVYNPKAIAYHKLHGVSKTFKNKHFYYLYHRNTFIVFIKNFPFLNMANTFIAFSKELASNPLELLKIYFFLLRNSLYLIKQRASLKKICQKRSNIFNINNHLHHILKKTDSPQKKVRNIDKAKNFIKNVLRKKHVSKFESCMKNFIFQVDNVCNANCIHCFLRNDLNKELEKTLSLDEINTFLGTLGKIDNAVLGGGEPFLRNDLNEICNSLEKINNVATITIPTNAAVPKKIYDTIINILDSTENCGLKISISLDGLHETHDKIRGVPKIFDKVQQLYTLLEPLIGIYYPRFNIQINSSIFKMNYEEFKGVYEFVETKMPLSEHSFETIRGNFDKNLVQSISNDEYLKLIEWLRPQNYKQLPLHEEMLRTEIEKKQLYPCIAGEEFIVLQYDGTLGVCEILDPVVNIRDFNMDFNQIKNSTEWNNAIKYVKDGKCYCSHSCFLQCSMEKYNNKIESI